MAKIRRWSDIYLERRRMCSEYYKDLLGVDGQAMVQEGELITDVNTYILRSIYVSIN